MARRRRPADPEERALLAALAALYDDVDAAYASHSCPSSSECCRFAITGREPYVTSLELLAVRRAIARRGGPLAPKRRALPLLKRSDERTCPLLDETSRCAVYADRPLGCRSFWCDRSSQPARVGQQQLNEFVRRLQDLAGRHEPRGDRGRALTKALASRER